MNIDIFKIPTRISERKRRSRGSSSVTLDILSAFLQREYVISVFIDLKAAYDGVLLDILITRMKNLGIPSIFIRVIYNIFINRIIKIQSNGLYTSPRYTNQGLPQGSVLSPILFLLYTKDITHQLSTKVRIIQYADDFVLYYRTQDITEGKKKIADALSHLEQWCTNSGLNINWMKTKIINFHRKRKDPPINLTISLHRIEEVQYIKYLGLMVDKKLKWQQQLKYINTKANIFHNFLKKISGKSWGVDPRPLQTIYQQTFEPIIYGSCHIVSHNNLSIQRKFESIQHQLLCYIFKLTPTCGSEALFVETRTVPFQIQALYVSQKLLLNFVQVTNSMVLPRLQLLSTTLHTKPFIG